MKCARRKRYSSVSLPELFFYNKTQSNVRAFVYLTQIPSVLPQWPTIWRACLSWDNYSRSAPGKQWASFASNRVRVRVGYFTSARSLRAEKVGKSRARENAPQNLRSRRVTLCDSRMLFYFDCDLALFVRVKEKAHSVHRVDAFVYLASVSVAVV